MEKIYDKNQFVSSNFTVFYRTLVISVLVSGISILGYKKYNGASFDFTSDIFISSLIAAGFITAVSYIIIVQSLWVKAIRKSLEDMINFSSKDCLITRVQGIAVDVELKKVAIAIKKDKSFIEAKNFDSKELCSEIVFETKQEREVEKVKTSVGGRIAGGLLGGAIGATIGGIAGDKYKETNFTVINNVTLRIFIKSDPDKKYDFNFNFYPPIKNHEIANKAEYKEVNRIHNLLKSTGVTYLPV